MYIAQPETFMETQFIKVVFGKLFGITVHITLVVTKEFCGLRRNAVTTLSLIYSKWPQRFLEKLITF